MDNPLRRLRGKRVRKKSVGFSFIRVSLLRKLWVDILSAKGAVHQTNPPNQSDESKRALSPIVVHLSTLLSLSCSFAFSFGLSLLAFAFAFTFASSPLIAISFSFSAGFIAGVSVRELIDVSGFILR